MPFGGEHWERGDGGALSTPLFISRVIIYNALLVSHFHV